MNIKLLTGIMATAFACLSLQSCNELTLRVKTQGGTIEGLQMEDGVKAFLGIPFAEAPVGELRWRAPQPKSPWKGVLEAREFGCDPMQPRLFSDMVFRGPAFSEDCLYLNVWTSAQKTTDALPVLIYFNGGGLMAGSGSESRYDGEMLAHKGVVTVTANYREGIFGFLAHEELSSEAPYGASGNYGFLDQVAAIEWVKNNISAFGGDPEHITIVGESAGSFSVSLLMLSPLSKDNLAGAILSSGAEVAPRSGQPLHDAELAGASLLAEKNVSSIADARALPAEELQELFPPRGMSSVVIDNYFLPAQPDSLLADGQQADIPLLAGWNSLESLPGAQTVKAWKEQLQPMFSDMTDEIFQAYGILTDEDVNSQNGYNLASDLFTGFPTWKFCDYHAQTSSKPVFRYKFNKARPDTFPDENGNKAPRAPGAVHSADIEYAMGNLFRNEVYDWQKEDHDISEIFMSIYANFCKNGDPNGDGIPQWEPINGKLPEAPVLQIGDSATEVRVEASASLENAYRTLDRFFRTK